MPGERTEQASQHRRQKARQDGDVLHSRELTAAAGMLAGVLTLGMAAARAMEAWRTGLSGFLALGQPERWEPSELGPTLIAIRGLSLAILAPVGSLFDKIS